MSTFDDHDSWASSFFGLEPEAEYEDNDFTDSSLLERVNAAIHAPNPTLNQQRLIRLINGLTPAQFEAATYDGRPLVILAGAGTGKTRTLTTRIALLVTAGMAQPSEILALTFTNKAAKEMAARIALMLDVDAVSIMATTFHSFCAKMLREYGGLAGRKTDWTILDGDDSRKMMRQCWKARHGEAPSRHMLDAIERTYEEIFCAANPNNLTLELIDPDVLRAAHDYRERKAIENVKDFGDLIIEMNQLLDESDYVREEIQRRFSYVLVDEYQDTDSRQEALLRKIMGENPNLTVVGDEDQLVYTWRQAEIDNILGFTKRWNAHRVMLEQNFRSTSNIIAAANRLIQNNQSRLGKQLYTEDEEGEEIAQAEFPNEHEEARWIAESIAADIAAGCPPEEIAVLVRATHALNMVEAELNRVGIRYTLSGGKKFQDRAEIKDISAYLRLIANAHDRMAFERAIAAPKRNVGDGLIEEIDQSSKRLRTDITDAARRMALGGIMPQPARAPVLEFCSLITELAIDAIHGAGAEHIITRIVEDTGYREAIKQELLDAKSAGDIDAADLLATRLANINDLTSIAKGKTLTEFLDHLGLSEDTRRDQGKGIWIGTIHAAKGLEFFNVYLPAWEQGVLPSKQSLEGPGDIEEERRLAYVALTRARKRLTITRAARRFGSDVSPSVFLTDLGLTAPQDALDDAFLPLGHTPSFDPLDTADCPF